MVQFDPQRGTLVGPGGSLVVGEHDDVTRKIVMLIEGECEGLGPSQAAHKFSYTRQRYSQIRSAFREQGAAALVDRPRGPKRNYRRTSEVVRQVIRHRFLDPDATAEVIAQKLRQSGWVVSTRSVERVFAEYGLKKKTLQLSSPRRRRA